jgi:hypothetical protein
MDDAPRVRTPADNDIRELAVKVVDFARKVGLTDDSELLALVSAAYRLGQGSVLSRRKEYVS